MACYAGGEPAVSPAVRRARRDGAWRFSALAKAVALGQSVLLRPLQP